MGQGCEKCAYYNNGLNMRKTNEEFIKEAIQIHENNYDYSLTNYNKSNIKVKIICKEHGIFEQTPDSHIRQKSGCNICGRESTKQKRTKPPDLFIEQATKIHNDKYDYSKVNYVNSHTKITIICKIHGEFEQQPDSHLSTKGCSKCSHYNNGLNMRKTNEEFIKEAIQIHLNKYDYSKTNYIMDRTKVTIICKIHGEFEQTPDSHIHQKAGCPLCVNKTEGKLYEILKQWYPSIQHNSTKNGVKKYRISHLTFVFQNTKLLLN